MARAYIDRVGHRTSNLVDDFSRQSFRIVHVINVAQLVRTTHADGRELIGPLASRRPNDHSADTNRSIRCRRAWQRDGVGDEWTNPPRSGNGITSNHDWL